MTNATKPVCGERVKMAREIRGLDVSEVADKCGLSGKMLGRVESGLSQPSLHSLYAIAVLTGFPLQFFRMPPPPQFPLGSLLFHCCEVEHDGDEAGAAGAEITRNAAQARGAKK